MCKENPSFIDPKTGKIDVVDRSNVIEMPDREDLEDIQSLCEMGHSLLTADSVRLYISRRPIGTGIYQDFK